VAVNPAVTARNGGSNNRRNRMDKDLTKLHWFKSSASAAGNCVEVAHLPGGGVAVRDSKDRGKVPHVYTRGEWEAFLVGAKNGEFDLPLA
jgi:Domain of unknown function (DUF397)